MASLMHVGGMQPDATGSGRVPLVVGYAWDGGWPIAATSGLVEDWFRDVGGALWNDALLATPLYEHPSAELHEDASASVREHPARVGCSILCRPRWRPMWAAARLPLSARRRAP
jgi:hypothetical protein